MSLYGSEKEFIHSTWLLRNPQVIEDILGMKLENVRAEVPEGRKKIDLVADETARRLLVYIENQITQSDKRHLKTIINLLLSISEGVIIWIAKEFDQTHLEQIKNCMKKNKHKYIAFYAVEIHSDMIYIVEEINAVYKLNVWNHLERTLELEHRPLNLVYSFCDWERRKAILDEEIVRDL